MSPTADRLTCFRQTSILPPLQSRRFRRLPLDLHPVPSQIGAVRTVKTNRRVEPYRHHAATSQSSADSQADAGYQDEQPPSTAEHPTIVISPSLPQPTDASQAAGTTVASVDGEVAPAAPTNGSAPIANRVESGDASSAPGLERLIAQPQGSNENLQEMLAWPLPMYNLVAGYVAKEVVQTLNPNLPMDKQPAGAITDICNKVRNTKSFTFLNKYENCWPVLRFIKMHLSHTRNRVGITDETGGDASGATS
ncbi:hypothetical protein GGF50DRAFT_121726 [Schizophyllum commune]